MRILGFYGLSDVGKTTLIEKLTNKLTGKYKLEETRGITLKVSYSDFSHKDQLYYLLDNPGHTSFSIETLRNIDLIQLGVYLFDATALKDPERKKTSLAHFKIFRQIFALLKTPFITVINKAQLSNQKDLSAFKDQLSSLNVIPLPISSLNPSCTNFLKDVLNTLQYKAKELAPEGVKLRVIKSFDVNKEGVPLSSIKGGVVGGYVLDRVKENELLYLTSYNSKIKQYEQIKVKDFKVLEDQIGSIETSTEPCFYKNDLKKGCYVITHAYCESSKTLSNKIAFEGKLWWSKPIKGQILFVIHKGQVFKALVKKVKKQTILLIKKDLTLPLFFQDGFTLLLKQGTLEKAQQVLGVGTLNIADDQS